MRAWPAPDLPDLRVVAPPVSLHDTASGGRLVLEPEGPARLYVCGITPYDATHMGHAATYVGFDLLHRAWRNAGHQVTYVQNVTDVDDPLLERATKVKVDWVELAERETELFRQDMTALRVLPPAHYTGAVESIPLVIDLIERMEAAGAVYRVDDDLYFSVTADPAFGAESGLDREAMLEIFPERGGDPDRPGKKDPLDCLVWRAEREGEPSWPSPFGPGRPGWHVECTAIAWEHLGGTLDAELHVDGADQGLDGVGQDRRLVASARGLLAAAQTDVLADAERARHDRERLGADDGRAQLRELALRQVGMGREQRVGHDDPQHRVTEELEALVVGHLAVLVRERPVRQGMGQQLRVEIRNSQDGAELVRAGLSGAVLVHDGVGQELREPDDARRGRRTGRTRGTRGAG